jgi:hypothetical protein
VLPAHGFPTERRVKAAHGLAEIGGGSLQILRVIDEEMENIAEIVALGAGAAEVQLGNKKINICMFHDGNLLK